MFRRVNVAVLIFMFYSPKKRGKLPHLSAHEQFRHVNHRPAGVRAYVWKHKQASPAKSAACLTVVSVAAAERWHGRVYRSSSAAVDV